MDYIKTAGLAVLVSTLAAYSTAQQTQPIPKPTQSEKAPAARHETIDQRTETALKQDDETLYALIAERDIIGAMVKDERYDDILLRYRAKTEKLENYRLDSLNVNQKIDLASVFNDVGIALTNKGEIDRGIVYYQKAIDLNPHDSHARTNLGYSLYKHKGDLDAAKKQFEAALSVNPKNSIAKFYIRKITQ